jgi:hypothetical protein
MLSISQVIECLLALKLQQGSGNLRGFKEHRGVPDWLVGWLIATTRYHPSRMPSSFLLPVLSQGDAVWRLPLHTPYRKALESKVADICSTGGEGAQGGAILAALFLQEFVKAAPAWVGECAPSS